MGLGILADKLLHKIGWTKRLDISMTNETTHTEKAKVVLTPLLYLYDGEYDFTTQFQIEDKDISVFVNSYNNKYAMDIFKQFKIGDEVEVTYNQINTPITDFVPPNFAQRKYVGFHNKYEFVRAVHPLKKVDEKE